MSMIPVRIDDLNYLANAPDDDPLDAVTIKLTQLAYPQTHRRAA